eukprot:GHRR01021146.1.p1 GENE.GHRR01021146.1~~GHRR01021146.1.p1  ORF type:complete len:321 (+),score=86.12 GHRR01021146.1:576-1538(+)
MQEITMSRYASNIVFEDPISRFTDLNGYTMMVRALKTLFNVTFDLHDIQVTQPDEITTRWTMSLKVWELPWQPNLLFSGRSFYKVDPVTGIILQHKDVWDAINDNSYLSLEGMTHVLQQLMQVQLTPDLETPNYKVLRVAKDFEIRSYDPFIVAEVAMPAGASPTAGDGFTDLAGFIFGGNSQGMQMEMTTPVITRSPAYDSAAAAAAGLNGSNGRSSMQFPLERKFEDVESLPRPNNSRVYKKEQPGSFTAAIRFSGWPLDFEVANAERKLRTALLRDGLQPAAGYRLARYNEPTVLPFLRRNEVLIDLQNFSWPSHLY